MILIFLVALEGKIKPGEGVALPAQTSKSTAIKEIQALHESGGVAEKEGKPNEEAAKIGLPAEIQKTQSLDAKVADQNVEKVQETSPNEISSGTVNEKTGSEKVVATSGGPYHVKKAPYSSIKDWPLSPEFEKI
ncbi:hypothetical protein PGT21_029337 [Puccinia graminis f. sp. tritici]|uniref:Uncharacterized protein n=1 Tax=Puccinia graminis f. sp. tritici TaxID=56615 RepID=A0A5B0Q4I5_PUCGR|nr:hypothetical protein PGT21_029337 [Puccinia graminis f. sp. tritici]KAA1108048.1 hypothetical protein PGTUg99_026502 [Puccinia graminis f. sp. tritici]